MATQVYLLRHGETSWSRTNRHTGRTDLPLTAEGERRAAGLRERLGGIEFVHVLTSPLARARRTCELAGFAAPARTEPGLAEWDYGAYEGLTTAEIRSRQPDWDLFRDGCPQGESVEDVARRADRMLAVVRPLDGIVALFSHGHFLRALAARWIGLPVGAGRNFSLETASVSILGFAHPGAQIPVISLWNSGAGAAGGERQGIV